MATSRDRQRRLAREKIDRRMARRAVEERRRRRIMAAIGSVAAVLVIVAGVAWLGGAFDGDDPATDAAAAETCLWTPQSAESNTSLKEVGTPPTSGMPTSGTEPMTITTNQGAPIVVDLDMTSAPCAATSLRYLAGRKFYDNTECHEITAEGALHCGDPSGTGQGGPTYSFYDESTPQVPAADPSASAAPADSAPLYPAGTVALTSSPPGQNGSQFLIFFKDYNPKQPLYPIVGTVSGGTDTLTKISKIPTVDNGSGAKVKPKDKVVVQTLTVGAAAPAPSTSTAS